MCNAGLFSGLILYASRSRLLIRRICSQLLNDVYGIQGRSGCSCTGPYGHRLWGWMEEGHPGVVALRKLAVENGEHVGKLGWARVNFNYFIDEEEVPLGRRPFA